MKSKRIVFIISMLAVIFLQSVPVFAFPDANRAWQQKDGEGRKELHVGDVLDSDVLGVGSPDEQGSADLEYSIQIDGKPLKMVVTDISKIDLSDAYRDYECIEGKVEIVAEAVAAPGGVLTVSSCYHTILNDYEYDLNYSCYGTCIELPSDTSFLDPYHDNRNDEVHGITKNEGNATLSYSIPSDQDKLCASLATDWRAFHQEDTWDIYITGVLLTVNVKFQETVTDVEETAGSETGEFSSDEIEDEIIGKDKDTESGDKEEISVPESGKEEGGIPKALIPIVVAGGVGGGLLVTGFLPNGTPGGNGASKGAGGGKKNTTKGKTKKKEEKEEKKEEEKKQSTYRIVLYKEFGDTLRIGEKEKIVGARIEEETPDGKVWDRPELTARIVISGSNNLKVINKGKRSSYMTAGITVSSPASVRHSNGEDGSVTDQQSRAVVSFAYTGEGGTFTSRVSFAVETLEPEIFFEKDGEWAEELRFPLLADTSYEAKLLVYIHKTEDEPEKLLIDNGSAFCTRVEKTQYDRTYQLNFSGYSGPALKDENGFGEVKEACIVVKACYPNDLTVEKRLDLEIYPEGICILNKPDKDGFVEVVSYANRYRNSDSLDPVIRPTELQIVSAVRHSDGKLCVNQADVLKFSGLEAETEENKNLIAKYDYTINTGREDEGYIGFGPKDSIPELGKPVQVWLPVSLDSKTAVCDRVRIPLLLLGDPEGFMSEWKQEHRMLMERIQRYFPPEMALEQLQNVKQNYSDPTRVSAAQLRFMSHKIIKMSQNYWEKERDDILAEECMNDFWLEQMELAKTWGDVAFSIIVSYYLSSAADIWLTPLKDTMAPLVGELVYITYTGEEFDWKNLSIGKNLDSGLTNYILNFLDGKNTINPEKLKQAASIMVGLLIYKAVVHYIEKDPKERDWLEALESAFSDLTSTALKKIVSIQLPKVLQGNTALQKKLAEKLKRLLGPKITKTIQEKFEIYAEKFMRKGLGGVAKGKGAKWMETASLTGNVEGLNSDCFTKVGYTETINSIVENMIGGKIDAAAEKNFDITIMTIRIDTAAIAGGFGLSEEEIKKLSDEERYYEYPVTLFRLLKGDYGDELFDMVFDAFFGMLPTTSAPIAMSKDPVPVLKEMDQ